MGFKSYVISYKKFLQNNIQTISAFSISKKKSNIISEAFWFNCSNFLTGLSASQQQLVDRSSVGARQAQIEKLYVNILNLGQQRANRLSETCKAYQLVREAAELANWIKTKEQHAQIQVI
jgi:hypothetical protein